MSGSAALFAGSVGMLAALAYATLAILVVVGRLRPPPGLVVLAVAAAVVAAAAGAVVALFGPIAARPAALAEVLLWTMVLALAGRNFQDTAARIAFTLALALTITIGVVAPVDPWLMATAAAAIIGLFLVAVLAGHRPAVPVGGRRLLLLALGLGYLFDIAVAGMALADAELLPWPRPRARCSVPSWRRFWPSASRACRPPAASSTSLRPRGGSRFWPPSRRVRSWPSPPAQRFSGGHSARCSASRCSYLRRS
jgi:hypothetical protein